MAQTLLAVVYLADSVEHKQDGSLLQLMEQKAKSARRPSKQYKR
ncbi:MAG TPA: hypothetical protein VFE38_08850 [Edaphobacter sp.]|nr:hypothetical protein [Edaphobacter sp.]